MRQYIGARYVPKFYNGSNGSNWDSGVAYEPLTIVGYLTNFYCSKKAVPSTVGAPNLNGEYWANIGLLGDVENRVQTLESEVNTLNGNIGTLQNTVDNLESSVDNIDSNLETANDNIMAVNKKRVVLIGDSYNLDNALWTGWGSAFADLYPNFTVHKYSRGGIGFVTDESGATFGTLLENAGTDLTDKEQIGAVVVLGGYNDASMSQPVSSIQLAISNFSSRCKELFPNADLYIGFVGANALKTGMQQNMFTYNTYYKVCCANADAIFIDNINYTLLNKNLILNSGTNPNNGFHPNTNGNIAIAKNLYSALKGRPVNVLHQTVWNNMLTIQINNGLCTIAGFNPTVLFSGYMNGPFESTQWYDFGELGGDLIWGGLSTHQHYQGLATIRDQNGNVGFVYVRYVDGKLQIMQNFAASFGTATENYIQLQSICAPVELFY